MIEYHSCYDELLSKLFLMSYELRINSEQKESINNDGGTSVSLLGENVQFIDRYNYRNMCYYTSLTYTKYDRRGFLESYDNRYDLTAHEIVVYSLLLHKCIEVQSEKQEISYRELQELRGKRKTLDPKTLKAYDRAFKGLMTKKIKYDLGTSRKNKKITYRKHEHPLLLVYEANRLTNGDKIIKYSLGPFGKTLIESKRYSTLIPAEYFRINFNQVMTYEIALYVCRMIYINQHMGKTKIAIKLNSIMKNISKFIDSEKYGIVKYGCALYYYRGSNTKRYWDSTIKKVCHLLNVLKNEYKINDYKGIYNIMSSPYGEEYDYQNVKWILYLNN